MAQLTQLGTIDTVSDSVINLTQLYYNKHYISKCEKMTQ